MYKFILLVLFIIITPLSAALTITNQTQKYEDFTLGYFYDETSKLTVDEIEKTDFKQTIPSQFTQGYKYGNGWFKLEFKNDSENEEFVLYFTESIWSTIDLYTKEGSTWHVKKNGLNIPLNERKIKDSSPAFNIHIKRGETSTFYVKGNTIASQIGEFQLYTNEEFFSPNRITMTEWYIVYAFILFAFVLLNLYNFVVTRESIYAYYIGYVLVYIIFSFMHSGVYIFLGFPNWQEGLHVLGQLTLFSLLLFSIEFLELKSTYPLMQKVFYWLAVIALIFALLLSQDVPYSSFASNIFFSATLITIVTVAVKILNEGFCGAKYYLFALMLYLPSMAMMAMDFNTILANTDITRYSFLGGAFVEIFLFTLILTNRYKEANKLNILLQNRTQELEEAKKLLTAQATTDSLSGLHNRRYFSKVSENIFNTATRYSSNLSIIVVDIDKFKNINDTYGHIFGDIVIKTFANILKKAARNSDIVARYGGEEFIILLPETSIDKALILAERIRESTEQEDILTDNGDVIHITVSVGVTQLDNESDFDIENAIKRCDKALYKAKNGGRNMVCRL